MRQRAFFATGWLHIAAQGLLLAILYAAWRDVSLQGAGPWAPAALVALVGIPSALWAAFFYLQDRRAPEPSRHVIASFIAGTAAASVLALPIERYVFETGTWLYESVALLLLGSTLVRGTLFSLPLYLVIHYGFVPSGEFDEPTDGMVYGAFAGSGFATVTSLTYLAHQPDFTLFAIGYTAALNILMYASVGALAGYLVGSPKFFPDRARRWPVLGILLGVVLIGLYHTANELGLLAEWHQAFWISSIVALTLSAAILLLAMAIARRHGRPIAPARATTGWDPAVCAVAVALVVGATGVQYAATRDVRFESRSLGIAFAYPKARLTPLPLVTAVSEVSPVVAPIFSARDTQGGRFVFVVGVREERVDLSPAVLSRYLVASEPLALAIEDITVAGQRGLRAKYVYLDQSALPSGELPEPRSAHSDVVVTKQRTFVFTLAGSPDTVRQELPLYRRILDSVRWTAE